MCVKGKIVLLPFPFTDLQRKKVRPAIVISNDKVNNTGDCLFAAITGRIKNDEFSFELKDDDLTSSLKKPSEVRIHKLFTGEKSLIIKSI